MRPHEWGTRFVQVEETANGNDEIQASLHYGGKNAAFGRDDASFVGRLVEMTYRLYDVSFV